MERTPVYSKNGEYRIVSVPNGLWRLQHTSGAKGSRTFDPWQNISHAIDFSAASSLLKAREPVVNSAA
jgi:hypothetical protein